MQTEQWALRDAKNNLTSLVNAAQKGTAQIVTRRGVPAAVVVSVEVFEKLQHLDTTQEPNFIDHLFQMPTDDGEFERMDIPPRNFS